MSEDGADTNSPVYTDAQVVRLFRLLQDYPKALLAVSGGPDSVALLVLAARWCALTDRSLNDLHVATVDHGLRQASAAEAQFVADLAANIGFAHSTLPWTGAKPESGLQAAAREARYRLLSELARARGISALVTAHTLDDQAETFMMRLARGSGLTGLAAMAPQARMMDIDLIRPLLGESKARLRHLLLASGIPFIDDPSNDEAAFERVRMRRALARLGPLGVTAERIALSAARLRRARLAIEAVARDAASRSIVVHPAGYAEADLAALVRAPDEILIVLMEMLVRGLGGGARPARLARIEALAAGIRSQALPDRATLGGCLIERKRGVLRIFREPGRMGTPRLRLAPGATALWDGRFRASVPAIAPGAVDMAPIGSDWRRIADHLEEAVPKVAIETGPAFRLEGELIAAPQLGFFGTDLGGGREFAACIGCTLLDPFQAVWA
jgi:tRNA(Ile)-lysidine synthase